MERVDVEMLRGTNSKKKIPFCAPRQFENYAKQLEKEADFRSLTGENLLGKPVTKYLIGEGLDTVFHKDDINFLELCVSRMVLNWFEDIRQNLADENRNRIRSCDLLLYLQGRHNWAFSDQFMETMDDKLKTSLKSLSRYETKTKIPSVKRKYATSKVTKPLLIMKALINLANDPANEDKKTFTYAVLIAEIKRLNKKLKAFSEKITKKLLIEEMDNHHVLEHLVRQRNVLNPNLLLDIV